MKPKLIIAANRLPVTAAIINRRLVFKPSPGGLANALDPIIKGRPALWFGFYSITGNKKSLKHLPHFDIRRRLRPINVDSKIYDRFYKNFANGSLWPVLHGFKPKRLLKKTDFEATLKINQIFAREIAAVAKPDNLIWVHDFHLMLLPKLLKDLGLKNKIGFFLHTPAPAIKLFKTLPYHKELLAGLAGAEIIGVHTENSAKRLRKCFKKLTAAKNSGPNIQAFPIGVDYLKYRLASKRPDILLRIQKLTLKYHGKKVIFSASRLDYTKGLIEQLQAFEHLLNMGVDPRTVIYKLVVVPSRENLSEYQQTKKQIEKLVKSINQKFGGQNWPVEFDYRNMEFAELSSWYARADIMLVAPLIDGMNLTAKEYVAVKPHGNGVLVLSEFAGAANQLKTALHVNPSDPKAIARALKKAIDMPLAERRRRFADMRANVRKENVFAWAENFINQLLTQ